MRKSLLKNVIGPVIISLHPISDKNERFNYQTNEIDISIDSDTVYRYKIFWGQFFLLPIVIGILFGLKASNYLTLIFIHLFVQILNTCLAFLGLVYCYFYLVLMDFNTYYLLPALSFVFILYELSLKKQLHYL